MRKFTFIIAVCLVFISLLTSTAEAKVLPRFQKGAVKGRAVASGLYVSPRLRADRKALLIAFGNLRSVQSVSYALVYQTDGSQEGASGSLDSSSGNTASRELLFGTCSAGVCRYHSGVKNARLDITSVLKNGRKSIRKFRIRV